MLPLLLGELTIMLKFNCLLSCGKWRIDLYWFGEQMLRSDVIGFWASKALWVGLPTAPPFPPFCFQCSLSTSSPHHKNLLYSIIFFYNRSSIKFFSKTKI